MGEELESVKHVKILAEFTGGLETVFNGKRSLKIQLPSKNEAQQPTIGDLVSFLVTEYIRDSPKKPLFVLDGEVRPGILVLINDADWELEGEMACELQDGDNVIFVSTLHGG